MDGVARNPAGLIRCEEGDDVANVVWLSNSLQGLNAQGEVTAFVGLGKARHVGFDNSGRDRVDTDPAIAERGREELHESVQRAFRGGVCGQVSNCGTGGKGRDHDHAATVSKDRQKLLNEEVRRSQIDSE